MAKSQNGYDVIFASGDKRLWLWTIPGCDRHFRLRRGPAGFILCHFILWFHESITRLDTGIWDDWAWHVKPIAGQTSGYSNHASGTAVDLDAIKHPLGRRNTFTATQMRAIRVRLRLYRLCLRWGGDYVNRADEMHFEIVRGPVACRALAAFLRTTPRGRRLAKANPGR
jgi:hypothetical protein